MSTEAQKHRTKSKEFPIADGRGCAAHWKIKNRQSAIDNNVLRVPVPLWWKPSS